jgi:hypothetical protein
VRVELVAGLNAHAVASAAASTCRRASSDPVAAYSSPNEGRYRKPVVRLVFVFRKVEMM